MWVIARSVVVLGVSWHVASVLMMRPSSHFNRNMRLFSRDFRITLNILEGGWWEAKRDEKDDDGRMQDDAGVMLPRQDGRGRGHNQRG